MLVGVSLWFPWSLCEIPSRWAKTAGKFLTSSWGSPFPPPISGTSAGCNTSFNLASGSSNHYFTSAKEPGTWSSNDLGDGGGWGNLFSGFCWFLTLEGTVVPGYAFFLGWTMTDGFQLHYVLIGTPDQLFLEMSLAENRGGGRERRGRKKKRWELRRANFPGVGFIQVSPALWQAN